MAKNRKHSWVKENIIRYIDGDLSEKERIDYINHLNSCETCSVSYKKIKAVLKDGYIKQNSPNLWDRVNDSITNSKQSIVLDNLLGIKYKLSYIVVFVVIILSTFAGNVFIFSESEELDQDISEIIFPNSADDFNSIVELSLLSVIDHEK